MAQTPQPRAPRGPKRGTLITEEGKSIQVELTENDQQVLVSGEHDSLLIPVHGLVTPPDKTGYVAEQVVADATLRRRDQIGHGLAGLEQGHHIVVNGLTFEIVEVPSDKYSENAGEFRMTLRPA